MAMPAPQIDRCRQFRAVLEIDANVKADDEDPGHRKGKRTGRVTQHTMRVGGRTKLEPGGRKKHVMHGNRNQLKQCQHSAIDLERSDSKECRGRNS